MVASRAATRPVPQVPECPHARPRPPRTGGAAPSDPCSLDWAHAAPMEVFSQHNESITTFTADYVVPDAPAVTASNILYYWIGLQDTTSDANPVIQPVLSYYPGSSPNNWYLESWNCCPAGHKIKSASVPVAGPGAALRGTLVRSGGRSVINSTDGLGNSSVLAVADANIVTAWNWVDIALETYSVANCAEYSRGGAMVFDAMTLATDAGPVIPAFVSKPYINGAYLDAAAAAKFTACCDGAFDFAAWPRATMRQN